MHAGRFLHSDSSSGVVSSRDDDHIDDDGSSTLSLVPLSIFFEKDLAKLQPYLETEVTIPLECPSSYDNEFLPSTADGKRNEFDLVILRPSTTAKRA